MQGRGGDASEGEGRKEGGERREGKGRGGGARPVCLLVLTILQATGLRSVSGNHE